MEDGHFEHNPLTEDKEELLNPGIDSCVIFTSVWERNKAGKEKKCQRIRYRNKRIFIAYCLLIIKMELLPS